MDGTLLAMLGFRGLFFYQSESEVKKKVRNKADFKLED
tara:strand:- start:45570 stop:45683 length:114 start_codon:yes stop_codon:yes gene_type:complete